MQGFLLQDISRVIACWFQSHPSPACGCREYRWKAVLLLPVSEKVLSRYKLQWSPHNQDDSGPLSGPDGRSYDRLPMRRLFVVFVSCEWAGTKLSFLISS